MLSFQISAVGQPCRYMFKVAKAAVALSLSCPSIVTSYGAAQDAEQATHHAAYRIGRRRLRNRHQLHIGLIHYRS